MPLYRSELTPGVHWAPYLLIRKTGMAKRANCFKRVRSPCFKRLRLPKELHPLGRWSENKVFLKFLFPHSGDCLISK